MSVQQAKIDYITGVASDLFLRDGIASVTIKDVAVAAGIGEATLFRYFSTKQNLVLRAAERMSAEIRATYFDLTAAATGLGKLEAFYNSFLRIYLEHPAYYRFIFEFDATYEATVGLEEYEDTLLPYMQDYLDAYRLGRFDGTVREIEDVSLFYLTTTHALMGLCKKLTMDQIVLSQDKDGKREVEALIDLYIFRLKNLCV